MGRKRARDREGIFEPNMTPLIDVSLVLVVILLVATPMALQSSIMVQRTSTGKGLAPNVRVERVEVTVTSSDSLIVNRRPIAREEFQATVAPLLHASATRSVAVRCRDGVTHGTFVEVLDELKQLGAANIAVQGR